MLPVGDRPILAHIVDRVRAAGGPIALNTYHRAEDVRAFARDAQIAVCEEGELLGTAGGLSNAARALGAGDVLVWNGDILADVDVGALLSAHAAQGDAATLAIVPAAPGEGTVGVDAAGRLVRLRRETTSPGEVQGGDFIGVHVVGASLRRLLPSVGCMVGDVYLPALRRGVRLGVHAVARFADIGTPERYVAANLDWLGAREAWLGADARVEGGVRVDRCVVGAGARVTGAGALQRCVVWAGAEARAPLADAVITREGVVHLGATRDP
jgi:mannose-1-phosphate guanylyltransferase